MRWNMKPVSFMKSVAACLSLTTMCLAPVAQGAAASKQKVLVSQYLKEMNLTTKKMTVLEYWRMVRHVYPAQLQQDLDTWVAKNRDQLMPEITATSFTDKDGKEQVRLNLSRDGHNVSLTFTDDEEVPLKFNAVPITKKELLNYNSFNDLAKKLAKQDPALGKILKDSKENSNEPVVLTAKEFEKLTLRQKAEYLYQARLAMESAQKVFAAKYGEYAFEDLQLENKYDYALRVLLGNWADAKAQQIPSVGEPCVVAGYLTKYGKNRSCGSDDIQNIMKASKTSCSGGGVACNPMVYGYKSGGQSYCVPRAEVQYATRICGSKEFSPLDPNNAKDKQRIIESYMKHYLGKDVKLKPNAEGKLSPEDYDKVKDYLAELKSYIGSAVQECQNNPLKKIQEVRLDQKSACDEIAKRAFILEKFTVEPTPVTPTPGTDKCSKPVQCEKLPCEAPPKCSDSVVDCAKELPGSTFKDGSCQCDAGKQPKEENGQKVCATVVITESGPADRPEPQPGKAPADKKDEGPGWWAKNKNWIMPLGVGLLGLGLFWWMTKASRSKSKPVYVPPAPVPGPTTTTTTTATPVLPPPVAPCSGTWVNGVCVPPVVTYPPATSGEGGTKTIGTPSAGGTR